MPPYPKNLLDEIRQRTTLSAIIGKKHRLKKAGAAGEFSAIDDPSLTVNDRKHLYWDFGRGNEGGDVFDWLQNHEGMDFNAAVIEAASAAGVKIPGGDRGAGGRRPSGRGADAGKRPQEPRAATNGAHPGHDDRDPGPAHLNGGGYAAAATTRREIVATYDYLSPDEVLQYQVVRFEWVERGKRRKSFGQRRPAPDEKVWVWGLGAGDFSRKGPGWDWVTYDEQKFLQQNHQERRELDDEVAHTLFRLPAVTAERLAGEDGQIVWLAEGEKKVLQLEAWGLVATCNSGGAGHWLDYHAELLRGCDVVILPDNDAAGMAGALKRARSLRNVARRVRVLELALHWPGCPNKGDVVDWAEKAGGDADKLYAFLDKTPDWKPILKDRDSKFGRVRWRDQDRRGEPYRYLIKGLVPSGEAVLWYGETQTGKSFTCFDAAMHIARGEPYLGRKVDRGLVVYCAMEAGKGFLKRMRAYRVRHDLRLDDTPFELLTKKADLFSGDVDTDTLIEEIRAIAEEWGMPVAVVVIDTYQAATPGMKEIAGEDVSLTVKRLDKIRETFRCGVWLVHHKNAAGTGPRGHTSLLAGIETAIEVRWKMDGKDLVRDADKRPVRQCWVKKQREGLDNWGWEFVLPSVVIGKDEDGDEETSCVIEIPRRADGQHQGAPEAIEDAKNSLLGYKLTRRQNLFMRSLLKVMQAKGISPATVNLNLPRTVPTVADYKDVRELYARTDLSEEEDIKTARQRIKQALYNARHKLMEAGIVATDDPYIWPTGRRVMFSDGSTWPPPAAQRKTQDGEDAPPLSLDDYFNPNERE